MKPNSSLFRAYNRSGCSSLSGPTKSPQETTSIARCIIQKSVQSIEQGGLIAEHYRAFSSIGHYYHRHHPWNTGGSEHYRWNTPARGIRWRSCPSRDHRADPGSFVPDRSLGVMDTTALGILDNGCA